MNSQEAVAAFGFYGGVIVAGTLVLLLLGLAISKRRAIWAKFVAWRDRR